MLRLAVYLTLNNLRHDHMILTVINKEISISERDNYILYLRSYKANIILIKGTYPVAISFVCSKCHRLKDKSVSEHFNIVKFLDYNILDIILIWSDLVTDLFTFNLTKLQGTYISQNRYFYMYPNIYFVELHDADVGSSLCIHLTSRLTTYVTIACL